MRTAHLVNTLSRRITEVLSAHPINKERAERGLPTANVVLLRGAGSKLRKAIRRNFISGVKSFEETQCYKGFMIAPTAIISGLG